MKKIKKLISKYLKEIKNLKSEILSTEENVVYLNPQNNISKSL